MCNFTPGTATEMSSMPKAASGKPQKKSSSQVDTTTKQLPQQARAQDTFELILETTGHLLDEVGLEKLSTNLVCKRAGLSPPALYRYFPNKYAILRELGERLMDLQDQAVLVWIDNGGLNTSTFEEAVESHQLLQEGVNEITRNFPGNIFVLRALRAIPLLREVRIASRDMVAERLSDAMSKRDPSISRERYAAAARLTTELAYAAMEMVLEEPERDAEHISTEVARMIVRYYTVLKDD
jgi:AcrR family transcriptional regulator